MNITEVKYSFPAALTAESLEEISAVVGAVCEGNIVFRAHPLRVQFHAGSLLPAAVRLAPFTYVCVNVNSLKRRELSCEASVMKRPAVMPSLSGGAYV